MQALLDV